MSFGVGCLWESLLSFGYFFEWMFWDIFGMVGVVGFWEGESEQGGGGEGKEGSKGFGLGCFQRGEGAGREGGALSFHSGDE